jgi:uncharacterized protein YjbI with pentapeptide repeats
LLILFSVYFAKYPGEWHYGKVAMNPTGGCLLEDWLPFSNTLDLTDQRLVDADTLEKITARKSKAVEQGVAEYVYSFPDRDLMCAKLDNADLRMVDLKEAQLQGASLYEAHLQGTSLDRANLQDAQITNANLQGATLSQANFQGARLINANLQGATLGSANFQGAMLSFASLQGANLSETHLEGATLSSANLQAAFLVRAYLQGADLSDAHLEGALLDSANLWGANLSGAYLGGASFKNAGLWRTFGKDPDGNDSDVKHPEAQLPVWLDEKPQLQAPSNEQLAKWACDLQGDDDTVDQGGGDDCVEKLSWERKEDIIKRVIEKTVQGFENNDAKHRIRVALAQLYSPEQNVPHNLDGFWNKLANDANEEQDQGVLPEHVVNRACLDRFVAQGLVTNYFGDLDYRHTGIKMISGKLADRLVKAADSERCPGLNEISGVWMAGLRTWAAQYTPATQMENKTESKAK